MTGFVRREITPLESVTLTKDQMPTSLTQAYERVKAVIAGDAGYGAAWKLGASTPPAQKALGLDEVLFAPLHAREVVCADQPVPGFKTLSLNAEGEIALRISEKGESLFAKGEAVLAASALSDLFDGWCVAAEMPSGSLTNGGDFGVEAIVLDRCAAGALVLGPAYAYGPETKWQGQRLSLVQDGVELASGTAADLVDSADAVAKQFLLLACRYGFQPRAGQWISTGGIVPCQPLKEGADVTLFYDGQAELSFRTGSGGA